VAGVALLVGILLAVLVLPAPWNYMAVAAGGAIEVGEAALWWRWTHRRRPVVGAESLVGADALVVEPCRPVGRVRTSGELWRARCDAGADPGETVTVRALEGLTLIVERAAAEPATSAADGAAAEE
jgi:membrane protein implicated in regulation of membrane protease activity